MACKVVNVRSTKPDVYIGRGSQWGNPFQINSQQDRTKVIERYREHLWAAIQHGDITLDELRALDGKTLGCYCAPKACHGEVLASAVTWALGQP